MQYGSTLMLWAYALVWLYVINIFKSHQFQEKWAAYLNLSERHIYEVIIILSWQLLKLLSVTLDSKSANEKIRVGPTSITAAIGYTFYYPNLVLGPIMVFRRYNSMLQSRFDTEKNDRIEKRIFELLTRLLRIIFWMLLTDFSLHFIYLTNLQYNMNVSFS